MSRLLHVSYSLLICVLLSEGTGEAKYENKILNSLVAIVTIGRVP
jgi:hypothetical protein